MKNGKSSRRPVVSDARRQRLVNDLETGGDTAHGVAVEIARDFITIAMAELVRTHGKHETAVSNALRDLLLQLPRSGADLQRLAASYRNRQLN